MLYLLFPEKLYVAGLLERLRFRKIHHLIHMLLQALVITVGAQANTLVGYYLRPQIPSTQTMHHHTSRRILACQMERHRRNQLRMGGRPGIIGVYPLLLVQCSHPGVSTRRQTVHTNAMRPPF